ncbi:hypothetical protein KAS33_02505 [bacterium]|nr:hypothetical protein [bacterium]
MDGKNKSLGDLSTNFWSKEFRCPCKKCRRKKVLVDGMLLFKAEMVRMECGSRPMTITSGNRCSEENKRIGGHPNSAHIPMPKGKGIDSKIRGKTPLEVGLAAEKVGGLRIGIAKTYCHLDVKPPCPSKFWIYTGKRPIYSGPIENSNLLKFYQIITGKGGEK